MLTHRNADKPANAVALSETRRGTARFDLGSLFDVPTPPAPVATAQKSLTHNEGKIVVLARSVRRLAPAA